MPEENNLGQGGEPANETTQQQTTPPEGGAGTVYDEIDRLNASIDAEEEDADADTTSDTEEDKKPVAGEEPEDTADKTADKTGEESDEETDGSSAAADEGFSFTEDGDYDTFVAERDAYLETVEITPELQTILDRQNAELTAARTAAQEWESVGRRETVSGLMAAVNEIFETEMVDNVAVPKTKPLVEYMRSNFKNEFSPLAVEILASPSGKYRGSTMFEEVLIDQYDAKPEQIKHITKYLEEGEELPVPPPGVRLPASVHESLKEAWYKLPEIKRFEVEGLTTEIAELTKELNDPETSSYDKQDIKERLAEKQTKLAAEVEFIQDRQSRINGERRAMEIREQQDREAVEIFVGQVVSTYNTKILDMADVAAKDLAPRLTYVDADAQLGEARDKLARVYHAFSFTYDSEGNIKEDPLADHYAKQLKEEGINYDFDKGRQLLKDHFNATWKLEHLKATKASAMAIERAEDDLARITKDIKSEQQEVLGLVASHRVRSSNKALEKKVEAVKEKKQQAVKRIGGQPITGQRTSPQTQKEIDAEIASFNRQRDEENSYMNDDILFGRQAPPSAPKKQVAVAPRK